MKDIKKIQLNNKRYNDFCIIEGESYEEIIKKIRVEVNKRDWDDKDCYIEEIYK